MNLKTDCIRYVPLSFETVEDFYEQRTEHSERETRQVIHALCLSHERLRAELEGAEKLLAEKQA